MNLDDFTLYVPIRDRLECAPRVAAYYADLPCRKIMVDSTRRGQLTKDTHYESFEYHFVGKILYHQKIHLILHEFVNTPFVADTADDDVMLKGSIFECVEFLRNHGDYTLCDGEYANLDPSDDRTLRDRNRATYYAMTTLQPTSTQPSKRLYNALRYYLARNHAVMRTAVSRLAFQIFVDNDNLQPIKFIDRVFTAIAAIKGNFHTLSRLHQIKTNRGRISHRPHVMRELRFGRRIKNHLEDLKPISRLLADEEPMDIEQAHWFVMSRIKDCLRPRVRRFRNHEYDREYKPSWADGAFRDEIQEVIKAVQKHG